MNAVEKPSFETDEYARVFQYVERNGAASVVELRDHVHLPSAGVEEIAMALSREGYLSAFDGALQLVLGASSHRVTGSPVTVRPARQGNLSTIVDTIRSVVDGVQYPAAATLANTLDREGVLNRHNERETRMVFSAVVDEETIGWVHLGASSLQRSRRTVEGTLGVRPEFRQRRIGTNLLRRGCEWAAGSGFQRACQRLPATNERALTFLETIGWERVAVWRNRYEYDGVSVDEVQMANDL